MLLVQQGDPPAAVESHSNGTLEPSENLTHSAVD